MAKKRTGKKKGRARRAKADEGFERVNGYLLNAVEDAPDFRDFAYQPALLRLKEECEAPKDPVVLDQGREGACTGFGLAAVINSQLAERGSDRLVSPRMLYEMAKKYDEWKGEEYSGSSCRGAIRGWHSMGVCRDELAPYRASEQGWSLEINQAKDARATTLGAYYRVRKRLSDYHAAINEAGALYASAQVHKGWQRGSVTDGKIPFKSGTIGGHAFAIVGYNHEGFWVQNSWGPSWGDNGIALWSYEDWLANVRDCWVVRLALSTPQIWHLTPPASSQEGTEEGLFKRSPKRAEIVGHFVHIDDGKFDSEGRYWADLRTVEQTAEFLADPDPDKGKKYDHLLLYAHGGLNSIKASARRIVAMKEVFKANRIYPFHFMYDTGLLEEIKDLVIGKKKEVEERAGGFTDFTDKLIEKATRHAGRAVWREMKNGARRPFEPEGAGTQTIAAFLEAMAQPGALRKKVHMVGHSTGAILLASLLEALGRVADPPRIHSCSLLAPACTHKAFKEVYRPLLKQRDGRKYGISRMKIYNLEPKLELKDTVTPLYRKSLLYLVSNAFEEKPGESILGMQDPPLDLSGVPGGQAFQIHESDGTSRKRPKTRTASKTHGGFDNDLDTMNDLLRTVLGKTPEREFTKSDLKY
ncbi:MAG: C1 family peptidase [Thermoanaerobaculia bacterium]